MMIAIKNKDWGSNLALEWGIWHKFGLEGRKHEQTNIQKFQCTLVILNRTWRNLPYNQVALRMFFLLLPISVWLKLTFP